MDRALENATVTLMRMGAREASSTTLHAAVQMMGQHDLQAILEVLGVVEMAVREEWQSRLVADAQKETRHG